MVISKNVIRGGTPPIKMKASLVICADWDGIPFKVIDIVSFPEVTEASKKLLL